MQYVILVTFPEGNPAIWGPFGTQTEALAFEDRHLDPPAGSMAEVLPLADPRMADPDEERGGLTDG